MDTSNQLDPQAVNLAKAIRQTESGGDFNAQGKSGEWGAFQFTKPTWDSLNKKYGTNYQFGNATPEQQNELAYKQIKDWKDAGNNVGQVASMWNAGENKPNAYLENWKGTNSQGIKFDTPAYAKSVATAYQTIKGGGNVQADPNNPSSTANNTNNSTPNNPMEGGTPNAPATGQENILQGIGKGFANIPSSALNLGGNLLGMALHPVKTVEGVTNTISGGLQELGGAKGTDNQQTQTFDAVINGLKDRYGSLDALKKTAINDPVGIALDIATLLEGGGAAIRGASLAGEAGGVAELTQGMSVADKASFLVDTSKAGALGKGAEIGQNVSDIGKTINPINLAGKAVSSVTSPIAKGIGAMTKYGVGQLTGFSSEDVGNLINGVDKNLTRKGISGEIKSALDSKISELEDSGNAYQPIKETAAHIMLPENTVENVLSKYGISVDDAGQLKFNKESIPTSPADRTALQHWYNTYGQDTVHTPNSFLNMRRAADDMGYNQLGSGKTNSSSVIARELRHTLNDVGRPQIPGLEELDSQTSTQLQQLRGLKKGILDKQGNLLDSATNRVIGSLGKGKAQINAQMEELVPGISDKIKQLKTVERLNALRDNTVGTYTKSIVGGGGMLAGIATGNPALIGASIADMILTNPDVASNLLKTYGKMKGVQEAILKELNSKIPQTGGQPALNIAQKFNPPVSAFQQNQQPMQGQ